MTLRFTTSDKNNIFYSLGTLLRSHFLQKSDRFAYQCLMALQSHNVIFYSVNHFNSIKQRFEKPSSIFCVFVIDRLYLLGRAYRSGVTSWEVEDPSPF